MIVQKSGFIAKIIQGFMRGFFRLLYHSFAGAYDTVAAAVSFGRWNIWGQAALKLVSGPRVLELGCGPGHLQVAAMEKGWGAVGIDESWQMLRLARQRLASQGAPLRLARALAQRLPYASQVFDSVVATFPTLYILHPDTLQEIYRVLKPGGRLVVLWAALITGKSKNERLLSSIYRITHESPAEDANLAAVVEPYQAAGFQASLRFMELPGTRLIIIIATKPANR